MCLIFGVSNIFCYICKQITYNYAMAKEYFIIYNGRQVGPMPVRDLLQYGLNPHSQVWCQGMPQWAEAYTVPEVMGVINAAAGGYSDPGVSVPPPAPDPIHITEGGSNSTPHNNYPHNNRYNYSGSPQKSNIAFGLLAIFLGFLGIQYFYVGKTTGGIICLLLSFVTCGIWNIITFIQGILVICMDQSEFERKFVYSNSTFPIL